MIKVILQKQQGHRMQEIASKSELVFKFISTPIYIYILVYYLSIHDNWFIDCQTGIITASIIRFEPRWTWRWSWNVFAWRSEEAAAIVTISFGPLEIN